MKLRIITLVWILLGIRATVLGHRRWPIAPFDMFAEGNGPRFKEFRFSFVTSDLETPLFDCAELVPLERFRVTALLDEMRTMSPSARTQRLRSIFDIWRGEQWLPINQRATRYRYESGASFVALRLWIVDIDLTKPRDGVRSTVMAKRCLVEVDLQ